MAIDPIRFTKVIADCENIDPELIRRLEKAAGPRISDEIAAQRAIRRNDRSLTTP